jgi:hypothetical protein
MSKKKPRTSPPVKRSGPPIGLVYDSAELRHHLETITQQYLELLINEYLQQRAPPIDPI